MMMIHSLLQKIVVTDSSSENNNLDSVDEDCVDKDCNVPFIVPFNLITNGECLLPPDSAFDYCA